MHVYRSPWSSFLTLVVAVGGSLLGAGCSPQIEAPDPVALRRAFPEQAAAVLAQGEGFVATPRGFARSVPAQASAWSRVEAELPSVGEGSIRLRTSGGFEVQVREVEAEGRGSLVERAVAYRRTGGTAYWTAAAGEVEEWLHLARSRGDVAAAWEVEGAALEQQGEQVALVDAAGMARLWVSAPAAYASGGRPVRAGLRVEGARIELSVEADGEEVLVDPVWSATLPMNAKHAFHAMAVLQTGEVLVVSGVDLNVTTTVPAERYSGPIASIPKWTPTPAMFKSRKLHTATPLKGNGMVLVTGGSDNKTDVPNAELYNPMANSWSQITSIPAARYSHRATRLDDDNVLVTGGKDLNGAVVAAELYTPAPGPGTGTWSAAGSMMMGRYDHEAVLLADNKVLVMGGYDSSGAATSSVELYDRAAKSWSMAKAMDAPRANFTATQFADGKVLVTGGVNAEGNALRKAELYDPIANAWSPAGDLGEARHDHTATLLTNGKVLVIGGFNETKVALSSVELYDPIARTWSPAGDLSGARHGHTATRLDDTNRVLVVGGYVGMDPAMDATTNGLNSAELYTPLANGSACDYPSDCVSGYCVDGICCDSSCSAGPCEACSRARGAQTDGTCTHQKACPALDACHLDGICNPKTGQCKYADTSACAVPIEDAGANSVPDDAKFTLCASDEDCKDNDEAHRACSIDGVCCNETCGEPCRSCVVPTHIGECWSEEDRDQRHACHVDYLCTSTCSGAADNLCRATTADTKCALSECFDEIHGAGEARCANDGSGCQLDMRAPFDCTPYRCVKALGYCWPHCNSVDDCAPGFVCNKSKGDCVPPPDKAYSQTSGCALARGGAAGDAAGLGAFGVALLAAWRRRERRPGPRRQAMM